LRFEIKFKILSTLEFERERSFSPRYEGGEEGVENGRERKHL